MICTAITTECVVCGATSSQRKLKTISNQIRDYYLIHHNLIIKSSHQICENNNICSSYMTSKPSSFTQLINIAVYNPRQHSISQKYLQRMHNLILKGQIKQQKQQYVIDQQHVIIENLKKTQIPNTKYQRRNTNKEIDYEMELQQIPNVKGSNRWKNHIQYKLLSEVDCKLLSGRTRTQIIQQAKICKYPPIDIFYTRCWIYRYESRELQASHFGISRYKLMEIIDETLDKIDEYWSKPYLLNGIQPLSQQYWNRKRAHSFVCCPQFAYIIRGINPEKDQNIYTADGTYQYTQTVHASHEVRKKQQNGHKHRSLIKIHIWACPNGQPILGQYFFGDGYNSDTQAWKASLDESYIRECI